MAPPPPNYDPRRPMCVAFGALGGCIVGFAGTATYFRFDGQSLPAAVLPGVLEAPIGGLIGWLTYITIWGRWRG